MIIKKCCKCKEVKPISEFYKDKYTKNGYTYHCKSCGNERAKKYKENNREKIREYQRKWYENHIERYKEWYKNNSIEKREYYQKNRDKILEASRSWRKNNPERRREYDKKYYKRAYLKRMSISKFKLSKVISVAVRRSLKGNKNGKHWECLVGYSLEDLINNIERQFEKGMSWDNYGYYGWHIDHILPISLWKFKSYKDKEFKECWALSNLQPLWADENMSKGNRI